GRRSVAEQRLASLEILMRSGFGQAELDDAGAFGAEARLAVGEIEAPEPAEAFVEAERPDLVPGRLEALAPVSQGIGIVLREAADGAPTQAGAVGLGAQASLGRQHAAGEDVLLDEVGTAAVAVEQLVADGDDLQARAAAGLQHAGDL